MARPHQDTARTGLLAINALLTNQQKSPFANTANALIKIVRQRRVEACGLRFALHAQLTAQRGRAEVVAAESVFAKIDFAGI